MKKWNLKSVASLGLSLCILAGSALPGFAAEGQGDGQEKCEHEWDCHEEITTNCMDVEYTIRNADGETEKIILCPTCGRAGSKDDRDENAAPLLTEVKQCFSNFSGLNVFKGALENGMEVMTVAYYYPERTETIFCKKCGAVKEVNHTDDRRPERTLDVTLDIPVESVEGYKLMRVNADGTETELEVSRGEKRAFLKLTVEDGACLIHLVKE